MFHRLSEVTSGLVPAHKCWQKNHHVNPQLASLTLWSLKGLCVSKAAATRWGGLLSIRVPEWPHGIESHTAHPAHERQMA